MIQSDTQIKVRYDEVDKMGYVYHGNYAKYFHISRTQLLRNIGINDKILESKGIIMPVTKMCVKYLKPVFYDDIIKIKTTLTEVSGVRLKFDHLVFNQKNEVINKANSTLVFVNHKTRKPIRIANDIIQQNKTNNNG